MVDPGRRHAYITTDMGYLLHTFGWARIHEYKKLFTQQGYLNIYPGNAIYFDVTMHQTLIDAGWYVQFGRVVGVVGGGIKKAPRKNVFIID